MKSKVWKDTERRIAKEFDTVRTPLSGGNSRHTRSDTLHKRLFIEVKHRKGWAISRLFRETRDLATKEKKIPLVCLHEPSYPGYLVVCRPEDMESICKEWKKGNVV